MQSCHFFLADYWQCLTYISANLLREVLRLNDFKDHMN